MSDCNHRGHHMMEAIARGKCPVCLAYDHETLMIALRRIRSLADKNVPKYAQNIATEAISRAEASRHHVSSPPERDNG